MLDTHINMQSGVLIPLSLCGWLVEIARIFCHQVCKVNNLHAKDFVYKSLTKPSVLAQRTCPAGFLGTCAALHLAFQCTWRQTQEHRSSVLTSSSRHITALDFSLSLTHACIWKHAHTHARKYTHKTTTHHNIHLNNFLTPLKLFKNWSDSIGPKLWQRIVNHNLFGHFLLQPTKALKSTTSTENHNNNQNKSFWFYHYDLGKQNSRNIFHSSSRKCNVNTDTDINKKKSKTKQKYTALEGQKERCNSKDPKIMSWTYLLMMKSLRLLVW